MKRRAKNANYNNNNTLISRGLPGTVLNSKRNKYIIHAWRGGAKKKPRARVCALRLSVTHVTINRQILTEIQLLLLLIKQCHLSYRHDNIQLQQSLLIYEL